MRREKSQDVAVVVTLTCIECESPWVEASERWRMYLSDDDPREAVLYCHLCARREFGPWETIG